ncbi:MAG: hypothetical protein QOJ03_1823 [Frankiaceae bacterium]|nr:hypothetical protein [Frankiaceae bacterium]
MNDLARQLGVGRSTVRSALVREGVAIRPRSMGPEVMADAVRLYEAGWSVSKIGTNLGFDGTTVWRGLQSVGVTLRRPWDRG